MQNNVISGAGDSKQILIELKENNERQQEIIEGLKGELEIKQRENQVYKNYSTRSGNGQMIEKMIEKTGADH